MVLKAQPKEKNAYVQKIIYFFLYLFYFILKSPTGSSVVILNLSRSTSQEEWAELFDNPLESKKNHKNHPGYFWTSCKNLEMRVWDDISLERGDNIRCFIDEYAQSGVEE